MPSRTSRQLAREGLGNFLGINLRRDSLAMADEDLVRSINADLHRTPGVLYLRHGRSRQSTTTLAGIVRYLAKINGQRYAYIAGTLYRNFTALALGLSGLRTTVLPSRPLNDPTTWDFIANDANMQKYDGTTLRQWGIDAPTATPALASGGAGALTGSYGAVYTYARVVGTSVAHESNPCPLPTAIVLAANTLNIPVVVSTDPQVTNIRVYRTATGGSAYLFDQQVANATTTITSSQADSGLGTAVEFDNDVPPNAPLAVEFQGSIFLAGDLLNPHYLWYSKRFRPESFPADFFLELGNPTDPINALSPQTGLLGAFTALTKYRVSGNTVSGFVGLEAMTTRGTPAPQAVLTTSRGALFIARDGLWVTNFVQDDQELSALIQGLFGQDEVNGYAPIDWAQADTMSLAEWKRRLYFGYHDTNGNGMMAVYSLDTQRWYHYRYDGSVLFVEEDVDQLIMGDPSGAVWILEDAGATEHVSIDLDVLLPERAGGDRWLLKRFDYVRVDAIVPSGTLLVTVYIDGVVRQVVSVTGTSNRILRRMPDRCLGRIWQVALSYSGQAEVQVKAVQMYMFPLEAA